MMKSLILLLAIALGNPISFMGEETTILIKGKFTVREWDDGDVTITFSGTARNLETDEVYDINNEEITVTADANENEDRTEKATKGIFNRLFKRLKSLFKSKGSNVMANPITGEGDYHPGRKMAGENGIPIIAVVGDPGARLPVSVSERRNAVVLSYKNFDHFEGSFQKDMMPHLFPKR